MASRKKKVVTISSLFNKLRIDKMFRQQNCGDEDNINDVKKKITKSEKRKKSVTFEKENIQNGKMIIDSKFNAKNKNDIKNVLKEKNCNNLNLNGENVEKICNSDKIDEKICNNKENVKKICNNDEKTDLTLDKNALKNIVKDFIKKSLNNKMKNIKNEDFLKAVKTEINKVFIEENNIFENVKDAIGNNEKYPNSQKTDEISEKSLLVKKLLSQSTDQNNKKLMADQNTEKSMKKLLSQSTDQNNKKLMADQNTEKSMKKLMAEPTDQNTEKLMAQPTDQNSEKSMKKLMAEPTDQNTEKLMADQNTEKSMKKLMAQPTDQNTEKSMKKLMAEPTNQNNKTDENEQIKDDEKENKALLKNDGNKKSESLLQPEKSKKLMSKNFRWSKKRQKRISSAERDFVRRWQSQKESKFLTRENTLVQEECRTGWRLERLNGPLTLSSERVKDGVVRWYSESRGVGVISVDQPPEEVYFFVEDTPDAQGICVFKILIAEFNF